MGRLVALAHLGAARRRLLSRLLRLCLLRLLAVILILRFGRLVVLVGAVVDGAAPLGVRVGGLAARWWPWPAAKWRANKARESLGG